MLFLFAFDSLKVTIILNHFVKVLNVIMNFKLNFLVFYFLSNNGLESMNQCPGSLSHICLNGGSCSIQNDVKIRCKIDFNLNNSNIIYKFILYNIQYNLGDCLNQFTGYFCEQTILPCLNNVELCRNGGECLLINNTYFICS